MLCNACHHENREGRKFCAQCGALLELPCAGCGFVNEPGDRFCGGCGASLVSEAPPAAQNNSAQAERRLLTVLFCDLADSTTLAGQLDSEDLNQLNQGYQRTCTRIIEGFDGYVARYMGDGVLAYFGYPTAHENDAECAISAGIELRDSINNIRVDNHPELELSVRVGIATGPVVVGDVVGEGASRESTAVGQTPNLAARLQSRAGLCEVLVSDQTRQLAGDLFEFEPLGALEYKGIDQPQHTWRVVGEGASKTRFTAFSSVGFTPYVGRQHEMLLARSCWQQVCDGHGQVLLASGEPGIGKSRLIQTILDDLDLTDRRIIQCSPYRQSSAWYPVVEYLRHEVAGSDVASLMKLCGIDDPVAEKFLESLLTPETAEAVSDIPADQRKHKLTSVLLQLLTAPRLGSRVVLVVEDLHWVDPTTEELLQSLVPLIENLPVLLLMTYRPEYQSMWVGQTHVHLLALNRIDKNNCREMIQSIAGDQFDESLVSRILERTDGIPLFVEELTRSILNQEDTGDDDIPFTLADSLNRRLDALGSARRVARAGSVLGRVFDRDTVQAITRQNDAELAKDLEALLDSGLVYRLGTRAEQCYQFKHALIQDAAYAGLLREQRQRFHHRAANYMEARAGNDESVTPELVAHHFEQANELDKAVDYYCRAGQLSLSVSSPQEALINLQRAEAILESQTSSAPTRVEMQVHLGIAACLRFQEKYLPALQQLRQAEVGATAFDDFKTLSDIHNTRGNLYFPLGKKDDCLSAHQQSLQFAKLGEDLERQTRALGGLGDAYYLFGDMGRATEQFKQCCELADRHGFSNLDAANRSMIGWSRLYLLEFRQAYENALEAIELCKRTNHVRGRMNAETLACFTSSEMEEFETARDHERIAVDLAQKLGSKNYESAIMFFRARGRFHSDESERIKQDLEYAYKVSRKLGHGFHGPAIIGGLLLLTDDENRRKLLAAEAKQTLDANCVGHNYYWYFRDAIDSAIYYRDWNLVEELVKSLLRFDEDKQSPWVDYYTRRARLLVAWRCDNWSEDYDRELHHLIEFSNHKGMAVSCRPLLEVQLER